MQMTLRSVGIVLGVLIVLVWHVVWILGLYPTTYLFFLKIIAAIICLIIGTSYLNFNDRKASKSLETFRRVFVMGLALTALNLYFVHIWTANIILMCIALPLIAMGAIGVVVRFGGDSVTGDSVTSDSVTVHSIEMPDSNNVQQ